MLHARKNFRSVAMPRVSGRVSPAGPSSVTTVPYDYAASFAMTGRPGNVIEGLINISAEGTFVAVAIGYGFEQERSEDFTLSSLSNPIAPGDIKLGELPAQVLIEGFRFNPRFEPVVFKADPADQQARRSAVRKEKVFSDQPLAADLARTLFQRLKSLDEVAFLFRLFDSSTGREFQDQPINNLAALGKSNGERPFRQFAQPVPFLPRSVLRLQIVEQSDAKGALFIVIFGYKILGAAGCPEPVLRSLRARPVAPAQAISRPSARIIPFDYVARLQLVGQPGKLVEDEINIDESFVATALGYGLTAEELDVPLQIQAAGVIELVVTNVVINGGGGPPPVPGATFLVQKSGTDLVYELTTDIDGKANILVPHGSYGILKVGRPGVAISPTIPLQVVSGIKTSTAIDLTNPNTPVVKSSDVTPITESDRFDLSQASLRLLPPEALFEGIRIRPNFVRIAFNNDGRLANSSLGLANQVFERLNRPEEVSFRYTIFDAGVGRELQNLPINNIAGLGIANGERPFKTLPCPLTFPPRSTLRVTVQEHFGRGTLFFVFQGYKLLGGTPSGGRS